MSRCIRLLTLAFVLGSNVSAAQSRQPADRAQPPAAASDASSKADALIREGVQLRRQKRDAEALERFERAHRLTPSPRALAQIGLAELAISRFDVAEAHLREALDRPDAWVLHNRATLERSLNAAGAHLGSLTVSSNVEDAELWLNGQRTGALPLGPQRVLAGNVRVELRRGSGERAERALAVAAGAAHHVHMDFVRAQNRPRKARASAGVSAERAGELAPAPAASSTTRTVAWILLATGAVFLGEAVVAHVLREKYAERYNDDSECLYGDLSRKERCGDALGKVKTAQTLAIAGYIGAGLAFGSAGVLFATSGPGEAVNPSAGFKLFYSASF